MGWSPEQISGLMKIEGRTFYACPETIYRYIYKPGQQGLYKYLLAQKKRSRRKRTRSKPVCRYGNIQLIK